MPLNPVQVLLRPRNSWEAMDLGILLARRHAGLLMATWAAITLPLFVLLTLFFWQQPTLPALIIWWLKPAFERLPLHILSNALFANTPSFTDSIKACPTLLKPQLLASLTWRRLSLRRSFTLPIQQFERLAGTARQQRLLTLTHKYKQVPTWLTIIGIHIEMALWLGLVFLLYLLIPAQLQADWSWSSLLTISHSEWLWFEHLSNALYVLVLIVWEPVYVACGFTLYLNRRIELEAWDIELAFRGLAQRLKSSPLLIVFALLCLLPYSDTALAESAKTEVISSASEELDANGPRLLKQLLNSEQAQQSIKQILAAPPFKTYKVTKSWHFNDPSRTEYTSPNWLNQLLKQLSFTVQTLLWLLLLVTSAIMLWRYRQWLRAFAQQRRPLQQYNPAPKHRVLGLEVSNDSLPDDLVASAHKLWPDNPRAALSLLYRGLLNHLLETQALPLSTAHTEDEVLAMSQNLAKPLQRYSQQLTVHWKNLAWGQQTLNHAEFVQLCTDWQQLQSQEAKP